MATPEELVDLPFPGDVRLSPNGSRVGYSVRLCNRSTVWIDDRRVEQSDGSEDHLRWAPGGDRVAFRSNRTGQWQLYVMSVDATAAEQVTDEADGVASFAWAPDGERLAYVATLAASSADPIHVPIGEPPLRSLNESARVLQQIQLSDKKVETVAEQPGGWIGAYAFAPDGADLVFVRRGWPGLDGGVMPATVETASGTVLAELEGAPGELCWIDQGIYYQGTVRMAPRSSHCLYRLSDNQRLIGGIDDCLGAGTGNAEMICGHGPTDLAVLVARGLTTELVRVDPENGEEQLIFSPDDGDLHCASVVGGSWAAVISGPDTPPEVFVNGTRVSALASAPPSGFPKQQSFLWRAGDGLELDGVLLLPNHGEPSNLPMVSWIHGGPYGSRATRGFQHFIASWSNWALMLASAGFAVFVPNYRGGLGRGEDFATPEGGWQTQWEDIDAGIDQIVDAGIADPDRLGLGGWSAGGILSAWAVSHSDRFRAAVVGGAPAAHAITAMGSDLLAYISRMGNAPWVATAKSPEFDSIVYCSKVETPVLIMHGELDPRVPLIHAIGYHRGLVENGKQAEIVVYRGAVHSLAERRHIVDACTRIIDWYSRWML